ncbi:cytochrome P450 89A2-like [Punica granatum]|uniref:Cytochrome P450 89A2-like n=2 Tax=Punica granatum TaxID=22663 RepID=A0A6P8DDX8_PUNGR|nr:cytochrome P450 89A2-like [Punica granatum]
MKMTAADHRLGSPLLLYNRYSFRNPSRPRPPLMELWFFLMACVCVLVSLHGLSGLLGNKKLPPGPPTFPLLGSILWLLKSSRDFSSIEPVLRHLRTKYGPIVRLQIGSRPSIFIMSHEAAHKALVRNPTTFASRPPPFESLKVMCSGQRTIGTAAYGPLWRLLRQNLMAFTHPSRLVAYADGRRWAVQVLKNRLLAEAVGSSLGSIPMYDVIQVALFSLQSYMCFGEKFDEEMVRQIIEVQRATTMNINKFIVFNFVPRLTRIVFNKKWRKMLQIRKDQEDVMLPLIRSRIDRKDGKRESACYIDSIIDLQLADTKSKPTEGELVSLAMEFMIAGTDTSVGTMQWIMANVVKYQEVQDRILGEINAVVKPGQEIEEEEMEKMPYLKAVVLETLRRHPPGHFILPHAVTEDSKIDGYDITKDAIVNFTVAEMGRDPNMWADPMEFRPERFLKGDGKEVQFDIKSVREIRMMPFGAGRRICPVIDMAMLHVQLFIANMVRDFEWSPEEGRAPEDVDLSEVQDFTMVMKTPLRVQIKPRRI